MKFRRELIKPTQPENTTATYPAVKIIQNKHEFYFATIPVEDLFPYCFVSRRTEDPKIGFQRNLSHDRANAIAVYLDEAGGSIPTNIVLSAQQNIQFTYDNKDKTISYTRKSCAFLVIDGQHRLFGYGLTQKQHKIPVVIYDKLSLPQEAGLFIDINTNQKGVPASLLLDIKQIAEKETKQEEILRELYKRLNEDTTSVFYGYLKATGGKSTNLSRVAFDRGMREIVTNSALTQLPKEKQYTLIKNYFEEIAKNLQNSGLLTKSAYFEAFCAFFDNVLKLSITKFKNFKQPSLRIVLSPLSNIDFSSVAVGGKARVTKNSLLPILREHIEILNISADMV